MKNKLLAFLIFCSSHLFAQNITFGDLISLVNKSNWESVNQTLMSKGWTYYESSSDGTIEWSYAKDIFDKAKGWLWLKTSDDVPDKIIYQFHSKGIYSSMLKSILSLGFSKAHSAITDDGLAIFYTSKKYIAALTTGKNSDDYSTNAIYHVSVAKKELISDEVEKPVLKNGLFKEYDDNGNLTSECFYKNGILNGPYKLYQDNELIESGTYVNDKKTGKVKAYLNGRIEWESFYQNNESNGPHTTYYYDGETGKLAYISTGIMKNDKETGLWKDIIIYNGKQVTFQYFTYKEGKLNGPFKKIIDNTIIIGNYLNEELNGPYKLYVDYITIEGGNFTGDLSKAYLKEEGFYKNGVQTGKWKYYNENKTLIEEVTYVDGIRQ